MFNKIGLCTFSVLVIWALSCTNNADKKQIDEGIIEYKISYPAISKDDIMLEFLPNKMEFLFKNGSYRNNIVAGMGLFSTSFINNKENNSITQTVKLLNIKYVSTLSPEDLVKDPDFQNLDIKFVEGEKIIAGYKCKIAEVTIHADSTWTYRTYYTNEISIKEPNKHTPFEAIDGVLMDYQLVKYNTLLHFTATEVIPKEINEPIAQIEEGYQIVTADQISNEIKNIFAKLK